MVSFIKKHEAVRGGLWLALLIAIVFAPVIFNRQTLFSAIPGLAVKSGPYGFDGLKTPWTLDPGAYVISEVPQTIYWYQSLRQGVFPFWNPYHALGTPLSGDILAAAYNPFKLLFFFLFPHLKTFDFYILFKLLVAGFGTFLLLKKYGLSQRASILGGVAYMFSGYFIQWLTHWSLAADMMTPYILLAIEHFFDRASLKNTALVSLSFLLMVLSGVPEGVITISLLSVAYVFFKLVLASGKRLALFFKLTAAVFVALILAAPMLWDMSLFVSQGINAHSTMTGGWNFAWDVDMSKLTRALQIFISPSAFLEIARMGGMYRNNFVMPYVGAVVLLLAIAGISFRGKKRENSRVVFFGGYTALFLLMLSGVPPFGWLTGMPIASRVILMKYAGTLYFSLAILAAYGFWHIEKNEISKKKFLCISGAIAAVLFAALLFSETFRNSYALRFNPASLAQINAQAGKLPAMFAKMVSYVVSNPHAYAYGLLMLSAVFAAAFLGLWKIRKPRLLFWLMLLELLIYMPKVRDGGFRPFYPYGKVPFVEFLKKQPDMDNYRVFGTGETLTPNASMAYGLRDFRILDPIYLKNYVKFIGPALGEDPEERLVKNWMVLFDAAEVDIRFRELFNLGSVKYVISEEPLSDKLPYKLIYDKEIRIYENSEVLPLVYVRKGKNILDGAKVIAAAPNEIKIKTNTKQDGTLIYGDSYYPGWKAEIDGKNAPIFPAYGVFKSVYLPAGEHEVVFSYNPFRAPLDYRSWRLIQD